MVVLFLYKAFKAAADSQINHIKQVICVTIGSAYIPALCIVALWWTSTRKALTPKRTVALFVLFGQIQI